VLQVFMDKHKFLQHCLAIKRYLLLGQGDFVTYLMTSIRYARFPLLGLGLCPLRIRPTRRLTPRLMSLLLCAVPISRSHPAPSSATTCLVRTRVDAHSRRTDMRTLIYACVQTFANAFQARWTEPCGAPMHNLMIQRSSIDWTSACLSRAW
jgi:hypothetical protein